MSATSRAYRQSGRRAARSKWQKTVVFYRTTEPPGTIVVQTSERYLYVMQPGGRAMRYGIGVGRDGFQWQGLVKITARRNGRTGRRPRK